jgi:putrescine transport system substrate-binding protein
MNKKKSVFLILATLCAVIAYLFWPAHAPVKEPKPTQELHVLNWDSYFAPDTLSQFEKETGIRVVYDLMDSSEFLETKMLTGNSGYDVVFPSASLAERLAIANVASPIDFKRIKGLNEVSPHLVAQLANYSNASKVALPYTWGTIGISADEIAIKKRMPNADLNNWDTFFKAENLKQFADCGISIMDSPEELISVILNYLGRDPNSDKPEDLQAAADVLMQIRPYIKTISSTPYNDLASGEICIALSYTGDGLLAGSMAPKDKNIRYFLPKQGSLLFMDTMMIPVDAPNKDGAYAFINYLMRKEVMAAISNATFYPTANGVSQALIEQDVRDDSNVYPNQAQLATLFILKPLSNDNIRARTRIWTKFRSNL